MIKIPEPNVIEALLEQIREHRDENLVPMTDDGQLPPLVMEATEFAKEWDEREGNTLDVTKTSGAQQEVDYVSQGSSLHEVSYAYTEDDVEAWRLLVSSMEMMAEETGNETAAELVQLFRANGGFEAFSFPPKWAHYGFQTVDVDDKLAASWCATNLSQAILNDVKLPWPAFLFRIPTFLRGVRIHGEPLLHVSVCQQEILRGRPRIRVNLLTANKYRSLIVENIGDLADLAENEDLIAHNVNTLESGSPRSADRRALWAIGRILVGCCLTITGDPSVVRRFAPTPGLKKASFGNSPRAGTPPAATLWKFFRPIKVDVRRYIEDYLHERTDRKVTTKTFVTGHWKMQPHGPGHSLRRYQSVEGYWRGPEDAPIAVRGHQVTG